MAGTNGQTTRPRQFRGVGLSMTAAGRRVDLSDEQALKTIDKRPLPWQLRSYNFYDPMSPLCIGEVWFAGRYIAEAMSRIRIFPAIQLEPDTDPVSITSEQIGQLPAADRPTDQEIDLLLAATRRLTNTHGGQADIMRGAGLNNFLVGESYLIGRTDPDTTEEEWEIHSVEALELDSSGKALALKQFPDQAREQMIELDNATVIRIWRRHPRFPELPDAAMGAALTYCEDLRALTHMIRAAARSRMPSGILGIPQNASEGPLPDDEDEGDPAEGATEDKLTESLLLHFSEPVGHPDDAAAFTPFILRLEAEDLKAVQKWDFSRDIDRLAVELRQESRQSFAATVDLPADVMSGKAGLNDWSAWNVDEETFKMHLAPHAELIVDALTAGYLWPTISPTIENPRRFRLWYDASELIHHPNKSENAKVAHERITISDSVFNDALGFDDTDMPDDEERARRLDEARVLRAPTPGAPATAGGDRTAPTAQGGDDGAGGEVTAAGRVERGTLGYRLAMIEQGLIDRLLAAADSELRQALDRAGSRIVAAGRKRTAGESVRQLIAAHPKHELASRLGQSLLAAIGLTTDSVLDDAFDSLEDRWLAWTERAQRAALAAIIEEGRAISDEDDEALAAKMDEDRRAGWAALSAALVATATSRLFAPDQPHALGERDATLLVQPGAVRDALSIAGGGPRAGGASEVAVSGAGRGGLLSGETVSAMFHAAAVEELGWVWVYGDPSSRSMPFEPHLELDGLTFATWEDPALTNGADFPEVDFLYPSDHMGCQCTFARDGAATVPDEDGPEIEEGD